MIRPRLTPFLGLLLLLPALACAEGVVIETRDGTKYQGEIISETKEAVVLQIRRGSIVGRVKIPRSEIRTRQGLVPDGPAPALQDAIARARKTKDPADRAEALIAAAAKVELDADPLLAAKLYREAGAADPSRRDQTDVATARAHLAGGQEVEAEAVLREALERNPKNAQARAAVRNLEQAFETKARALIEPGVRAFMDDQPRRALRLLVNASEVLPTRVLDLASERVKEETGMTIAQMMVDCRLRSRCRTCDGAGVIDCPAKDNQNNYRCRFGRRVHFGRIERVGRARFNLWEKCKRCNGLGHLNCKTCMGMGMHISKPSAYEREELMKTLAGELSSLEERANVLNKRVQDDGRESAVRSVAATELLNLLQDIRAYSLSLSRIDARAGARGGGNLRRMARNTSKRMAAIMTALANALYVGGEQRYENAVNYDSPFNEGAKLVSPGVRAMQARQAWEIVNQARGYTLEALELDPSTAGPTRGDLRRRLDLMDRFLKRTWKTYLALRAVEEKWQDAGVDMNALYMNILQGAAGGGGGGDKGSVKGGGSSQGGVSGKSGKKSGNANGETSGGFKGNSK